MAQLRRDHDQFTSRGAEILVVGPEDADAFRKYWADNDLPFVGLPDPEHRVLDLYGQQVKLLKFGRMPAQVLVDKDGTLRFVHYANSMSDIPPNEELLGLLDTLNG
jgi:peroxiredoxin Q/BCP